MYVEEQVPSSASVPVYDIAIIGAGAAGLQALHDLVSAATATTGTGTSTSFNARPLPVPLRIVVFEGTDRTGGRTWTKILPGGTAIDLGAAWMEA